MICFEFTLLRGFGALLIRRTAVVGLVEARTFKQYGRAGPDEPAKLQLAALGTLFLCRLTNRLKQLEGVLARITYVIVSRHLCQILMDDVV